MKYYCYFLTLLFIVILFNVTRAYASNDWLSAKLIGCNGNPYANQNIKIQKAKISSNAKISWEDILTRKTDNDGLIYLSDADKQMMDVNKHNYRFYWEKSRWINTYAVIRSGKNNYEIGYVKNDDCCTKPANDLNNRIVSVAISEKNWSEQHYRNLLQEADAINDPQIFKNRILDLFKTWRDPQKERIKENLEYYSIAVLRRWWVNIQSEVDNSQKYRRSKNDYAYWCTGFASYVMSEAGGPKLVSPENVRATSLIDWFKNGGYVTAQDKQNYKKSYISREVMLKDFKNNPNNIPINPGSLTLIRTDKRIDLGSGGHIMINAHTNKFPILTVITGNTGWVVQGFTMNLHKFDDFHHWFVTVYAGAGELQCVQ